MVRSSRSVSQENIPFGKGKGKGKGRGTSTQNSSEPSELSVSTPTTTTTATTTTARPVTTTTTMSPSSRAKLSDAVRSDIGSGRPPRFLVRASPADSTAQTPASDARTQSQGQSQGPTSDARNQSQTRGSSRASRRSSAGAPGMPPSDGPGSSSDARGFRDGTSGPERGDAGTGGFSEAKNTFIWGTNISVEETMALFTDFLNTCTDVRTGDVIYIKKLMEIHRRELYNINIDCAHIKLYSQDLYHNLINYPKEMIAIFDVVINDLFAKSFPEETRRIQVRTFNLEQDYALRDLNPEDIDKLVSVKGMVTRVSPIVPELKQVFMRCTVCNFGLEIPNDRGTIREPQECPSCKSKHSLEVVHNRGIYADKQYIKVQETPESVPDGETPHTLTVVCYDDLVDIPRPGDRVDLTGIYRAAPIRVNPRIRTLKSVYRTYIDVLHIRKSGKNRISVEDPNAAKNAEDYTEFDENADTDAVAAEREQELRQLGSDPQIYQRLVKALAPSVWELEDIKKGILCQLFGGTNKEFVTADSAVPIRFRGEINVLLCGDPGTSKSQLLQYVHKLAPRGIYTSGKGSSAVGLTAYVTKDADSKEFVLESGALVLSDRGICCIDEFDKMSDSTRAVLHEVMEQQTVSIAKAGIICSLNARTSILASANPVESRYNPQKSVVENINLPPSLLSRFDLIYLVLDKANPVTDHRLATHLVSMYSSSFQPQTDIDTATLTQYISYARRAVHPKLTEEAGRILVDGYTRMRSMGGHLHGRKVVSATPRQLESLIRLSEAHARMRLSAFVEEFDVEEALRLMRVALQQAATDPTTGRIDMDQIATGVSATNRQNMEDLKTAIKEIISTREKPTVSANEIAEQLTAAVGRDVPVADVVNAMSSIAEEGGYIVTKGRTVTLRRAA